MSLAAAFLAGAAAFRVGAITQTQLVRERPGRDPVPIIAAGQLLRTRRH